MNNRPFRLVLVTAVLALSLGIGTACAQYARHPHLHAADEHAEAAILQMKAAHNGDDWFGGHRVRAVQLLQQAREQMRQAAIFADHHHD